MARRAVQLGGLPKLLTAASGLPGCADDVGFMGTAGHNRPHLDHLGSGASLRSAVEARPGRCALMPMSGWPALSAAEVRCEWSASGVWLVGRYTRSNGGFLALFAGRPDWAAVEPGGRSGKVIL